MTSQDRVNQIINGTKLEFMMKKETTFFSALLSQLKLELSERIPIASVDGISLYLNPAWLIQQAKKDVTIILTVFVHEVCHVAFGHCDFERYKHLDQNILNIAMDHLINLWLKSFGFVIPTDWYCDAKYNNMSTMEIYHDLVKNPPPKQPPPPTGGESGKGDGGKDGKDDKPFNGGDLILKPVTKDGKTAQEVSEIIKGNILKAVHQAEIRGEGIGNLPGHAKIIIENIKSPQLPWQVILAPHVNAYAKDDYSYKRHNRRFMPEFYLPTLYSEVIGTATAGVDVSGSMSKKDVFKIWSELRHIFNTVRPESMRVMTFDTKVHMNKVFQQGEELEKITLTGGGGTIIQPLLDSIRKENPKFTLIFTDGKFRMPDLSGITTNIYWIIKNNPNFKAPIGTIIPFV
jgi:predicted metal-dependent peptidase